MAPKPGHVNRFAPRAAPVVVRHSPEGVDGIIIFEVRPEPGLVEKALNAVAGEVLGGKRDLAERDEPILGGRSRHQL